MKNSVVVVDDDAQFTDVITKYLEGRGYDAIGYSCYADALRQISAVTQLVIIDLHLGDGDGFNLLTELSSKFPSQKYIVLTGIDSLPKRLQSFAKGADDYMKKPIFPSELEARIKRVLINRRGVDEFPKVDEQRFTRLEQKVLLKLLKARGELVPFQALAEEFESTDSAIYTCISRLRNKVAGEYLIKASYGRGWYLKLVN